MDELSRQYFVSGASGKIDFLKINVDNKCQLNTTLTDRTGLKIIIIEKRTSTWFFKSLLVSLWKMWSSTSIIEL
jgi:hypothetical protein